MGQFEKIAIPKSPISFSWTRQIAAVSTEFPGGPKFPEKGGGTSSKNTPFN